MEHYDPNRDLAADEWLALNEQERMMLVVHAIVENQLAVAEPVVVSTLARLRSEGLDRHDAIHAIGSVLASQLQALLTNPDKSQAQPTERYHQALKRLSAAKWRAG